MKINRIAIIGEAEDFFLALFGISWLVIWHALKNVVHVNKWIVLFRKFIK